MSPSRLTIWSLTKAAWEKAQSTNARLRDTLRTLQHDEVASVLNFSGLLGQQEFGQLLTEAGYGNQVQALAQKYQAPAPLDGLPADVSITPGLEGFERQLAATFRDRVLPAQVRALRKRSSTGSDAGGGLYTRGGRVPDAGDLSGRVIEFRSYPKLLELNPYLWVIRYGQTYMFAFRAQQGLEAHFVLEDSSHEIHIGAARIARYYAFSGVEGERLQSSAIWVGCKETR